jgi:repressor LexA
MDKREERLISFYRTHRRMPSFAELAQIAGYKSKGGVQYFVRRLVERGVLAKDKTGRLIPKKLYGPARLLGLVEAGFPSPAEEELTDTLSFDEYLLGEDKEATYILRVKGDSMIDAGICDGDMVVVVRKSSFKDGDIVIAEVDGEWTIKYYRERRGKKFLEPANRRYRRIYPAQELKVAAVVKAVVRKYG